MEITYEAIGTVQTTTGFAIKLSARWQKGLSGLTGFSHLIVLWHADQSSWDDNLLHLPKPYRNAPSELGIFATRSPQRPNSICQSIVGIASIDEVQGIIHCHYIDAANGSPVLDIKPWLACSDQPSKAKYPEWCAHWPATIESSGSFNWAAEFNFKN